MLGSALMEVSLVLCLAPHPSEAAVRRPSFHLQRCDVDLPGQSSQVLLFLHLDHCDHHRLQLHILCKWRLCFILESRPDHFQKHRRGRAVISAFPSLVQAFLGQLIFGEAQITLWWVGISLTFSGLLVLQRVSPQHGHQNTVKDE